jgi:hypothetical protein
MRGPDTIYHRARHSSVSDGIRFVYLVGSQMNSARKAVEKYDFDI